MIIPTDKHERKQFWHTVVAMLLFLVWCICIVVLGAVA